MNTDKLAFFKWIYKWVASDNGIIKEGPVDIPQIAAVLKTVGYKLETVDHMPVDIKSTDTITIELRCNRSGMRAVLLKELDNCLCPSSQTASESQFWSVSGMGPSCSQDNLNRVDETHSNLIPEIPKEKSMLIRDILTKLFAISSDTDVNLNDEPRKYNHRRSLSDLPRTRINRQNTWDRDFKTSPPKSASSPLEDRLSVSKTALNSEKEKMLTELLLTVKENLDKALTMLPNNGNCTFTKLNEMLISETKNNRNDNHSYLGDNNLLANINTKKTPIKLQNKENNPKSSSKSHTISKFGTYTKKSEVTPKKINSPRAKKETPTPAMKRLIVPSSSSIPDRRLSLGIIPKRTFVKANLNLSGGTLTANSVKYKSNIPSLNSRFSPTIKKNTDQISSFQKFK